MQNSKVIHPIIIESTKTSIQTRAGSVQLMLSSDKNFPTLAR